MSSKKSAVLSGVAALTLAASIIIVSLISGSPLTTTLTSGGAPPGSLSILLTDPPHLPAGVSRVYVKYSDLAIHVSGAGNQSGWTVLKSSGSIELLSTVNVSETISSANVARGVYDFIRFNITSAQVTYDGRNYTAFVPSSELSLPIIGGIEVNSTRLSATIIDVEPTVMNIGSASNPEFVIKSAAKAFPVPSREVTGEMKHEGSRLSLVNKAWWRNANQRFTVNLKVASVTLTPNSLIATVENAGTQATKLRLGVVVPLFSAFRGQPHGAVPEMLSGSALFVVLPNGTLVPLQKFELSQPAQGQERNSFLKALLGEGFNLAKGTSATLSYSGVVTFGFNLLNHRLNTSIVPGQQYLVTLLGDEALASYVVVAGR